MRACVCVSVRVCVRVRVRARASVSVCALKKQSEKKKSASWRWDVHDGILWVETIVSAQAEFSELSWTNQYVAAKFEQQRTCSCPKPGHQLQKNQQPLLQKVSRTCRGQWPLLQEASSHSCRIFAATSAGGQRPHPQMASGRSCSFCVLLGVSGRFSVPLEASRVLLDASRSLDLARKGRAGARRMPRLFRNARRNWRQRPERERLRLLKPYSSSALDGREHLGASAVLLCASRVLLGVLGGSGVLLRPSRSLEPAREGRAWARGVWETIGNMPQKRQKAGAGAAKTSKKLFELSARWPGTAPGFPWLSWELRLGPPNLANKSRRPPGLQSNIRKKPSGSRLRLQKPYLLPRRWPGTRSIHCSA